ncbi:hypothetical protein ABH15_00230 [Methanoculleus taiwanensis]|uniref:GTP-dependent dephospho-CoA kinase n=1 Tax=Methanoculleus taiwanensis TaxID=1550565 RepID=A0A498H3K4_9EURY|nr:GTP-dependent dephospho-CoA kinase family protein [Methanoculleus taiwanensis]RXE56650.1 hypothetical protein ABH15_00230 [Methanoculleus taiwanensis]
MYRLPDEHRDCFKKPFGVLYPDIAGLLPALEGRKIYVVGDVVTQNLVKLGITPDVAVIDGFTMRTPVTRSPLLRSRRVGAWNPAGMITGELITAIEEAVADPPRLIVVDGEEDLGVIPMVIAAPIGSAVLYGQPGEGVVLRIVDAKAKEEAASLLRLFVTG